MKKALVIGGANGIGLALATELVQRPDCESVTIVDRCALSEQYAHSKIKSFRFDLSQGDYSFFDGFDDIDTLIITAGFGRLALFKDIDEQYIIDSFAVNAVAAIRIIRHFYHKIEHCPDFYCGVMVSIAGFMSSPFFSVYAATKAALKVFIESVNVELKKAGSANCILNVSPGSIKGTSFNKGVTDLTQTSALAKEILLRLEQKQDLYIPQYDEIFKQVLQRYHDDFRAEGLHSYEYKQRTMGSR